jgi:hypothetical protein
MARKGKDQALGDKAEAERANEAMKTGKREKARQNAEKQRRYRERMKDSGAKQVLLWDYPFAPETKESLRKQGYSQTPAWEKYQSPGKIERLPEGMVKMSIRVHESSLNIAGSNPRIKKALEQSLGCFLSTVNDGAVPEKQWKAVYQDIEEFFSLFGKMF